MGYHDNIVSTSLPPSPSLSLYIYICVPRTRVGVFRSRVGVLRSRTRFIYSHVESRFVAVSWVRCKRVSNNMSLTFAAFWFCVLSASEPQIQFHGQRIVAPLSRLISLVLQISTPPVQFDIAFFAYVLELRSEYVLNTLLTTRPARFAAFWMHVLNFIPVSSF